MTYPSLSIKGIILLQNKIQFLNRWSDCGVCIQLFILIMYDSNRESIMSLAKYSEAAFDIRKQINNV